MICQENDSLRHDNSHMSCQGHYIRKYPFLFLMYPFMFKRNLLPKINSRRDIKKMFDIVEHRHENKALIIITAGYLITYVVSIDYLAQRDIM